MSFISTASFAVLINGFASPFFKVEHGLRKGCPLSPLIFLLVAECLNRSLEEDRRRNNLMGLRVAPTLCITHLLSIDGVLIFSDGSQSDAHLIKESLPLFKAATKMEINIQKPTITPFNLSEGKLRSYLHFLPFNQTNLENIFKYLGFLQKHNSYTKTDWKWLLVKIEKRLKVWSTRWLSRAGRLVLIKLVLEAIPFY